MSNSKPGYEDRARHVAVSSLNAWGEELLGHSTVSSYTNIVAFLQGIKDQMRHIPQAMAVINRMFSKLPQESGKADLWLYLPDGNDKPLSVTIEVKAFHSGVLSFDVFHSNQTRWLKSRGAKDVWVWLLGYPDKLPQSWRSSADRDRERAWLIPWSHWIAAGDKTYQLARIRTLRWEITPGMRKTIQENDLTVHAAFVGCELEHHSDTLWWPVAQHPLRELLDW